MALQSSILKLYVKVKSAIILVVDETGNKDLS